MKYAVRPLRREEYAVLGNFLLEAIFVPEGSERPPESYLQTPQMQVYIENFGGKPNDFALAAEADGRIAGVIWARIMPDYGHIDDATPSLAMAVLPDCRGMGIGTDLLQAMLSLLARSGHARTSLSVQKANTAALRLYEKAGFRSVIDKEDEYIMTCDLGSGRPGAAES